MNGFLAGARVLAASGLLAALTGGATPSLAAETVPTEAAKKGIAAEKSARGAVINAIFTTAVVDGEATDYRSEIENSVPEVFFVTVLDGLSGQTVIHRWKYKGKVMAAANIAVKQDSQKVWSSNKMRPEWTGEWQVEVVDSGGRVIGRGTFSFLAPL